MPPRGRWGRDLSAPWEEGAGGETSVPPGGRWGRETSVPPGRRALGERPRYPRERMAIVQCHCVTKKLQSLNLGQTRCLAFFQQNHKISRVQGRQQMLMYLDFGTAAHEIVKNGSNSPK